MLLAITKFYSLQSHSSQIYNIHIILNDCLASWLAQAERNKMRWQKTSVGTANSSALKQQPKKEIWCRCMSACCLIS